jgi:hypothetical protein
VPASARTAGDGSQIGGPGSLLDSTAHLFGDTAASEGVVRRLLDQGGSSMSAHAQQSWSSGGSGASVRRFLDPHAPTPVGVNEETPEGPNLEAIVDAVVERVEQRVIDELERRGRRQGWAAF